MICNSVADIWPVRQFAALLDAYEQHGLAVELRATVVVRGADPRTSHGVAERRVYVVEMRRHTPPNCGKGHQADVGLTQPVPKERLCHGERSVSSRPDPSAYAAWPWCQVGHRRRVAWNPRDRLAGAVDPRRSAGGSG